MTIDEFFNAYINDVINSPTNKKGNAMVDKECCSSQKYDAPKIIEYQTTPDLDKFFRKLLDLKEFIKTEYEASQLPILKYLYDRLDTIIKEKQQ
jgi:hypothetical protein